MKGDDIEKASPLYKYWRSDQTDEDEKERLLIANCESKAVYLFEKEPYKWECLFQGIARELINGDLDSTRGMKILLSTISVSEKEKVIDNFVVHDSFDKSTLGKLREKGNESSSKKNIFRTLRILFVIFTNPYGIVIRRTKNHIYEKTGAFFNDIKEILK